MADTATAPPAPRRNLTATPKAPPKVADPPAEAPASDAPPEGAGTATTEFRVGFHDGYFATKDKKLVPPPDGVDSKDPEYTTGYEQGIAAAQGATTEAPAEPAPSDQPPAAGATTPPAKVRADANALLSLTGGDKAVAMDYLTANLSMEDAKDKYLAHVRGVAKAEKARADRLELELAQETQSPNPVRTAASASKPQAEAPDFASMTDHTARAKAEWAADHDGCKTAFIDEKTYVGYRTADLAGQVKSFATTRR